MSEHTPGPWTVHGLEIRQQPYGLIARVSKGPVGNHRCNTTADARLIAAAPDLLAALELCYLGMNAVQLSRSIGALRALSTAQREAGEIIRKAKGQPR